MLGVDVDDGDKNSPLEDLGWGRLRYRRSCRARALGRGRRTLVSRSILGQALCIIDP